MVLVIEQLCKSFVGLLLPELGAAVPRIRGICQRELAVVRSTSNLLSQFLHSTLSFRPRLGILTLSTIIAMGMVNQCRLTIWFWLYLWVSQPLSLFVYFVRLIVCFLHLIVCLLCFFGCCIWLFGCCFCWFVFLLFQKPTQAYFQPDNISAGSTNLSLGLTKVWNKIK